MPIFWLILSILSPYAASSPVCFVIATPAAVAAAPTAPMAAAPTFVAVASPLFSLLPKPSLFASAESSPESYSLESSVIFANKSNTFIRQTSARRVL